MFSLMFVKKLCSVMCLLDSMLYDLNDTCHHHLRLTLRKRLSCWQRREIYVVEQWTIGFKGGRSIMNKNNDMTNAVNDSDAGAFDVEGNPLDTGRLWPINQAALISGVTTRTLRYYDETGLVKPAETSAGGKRWYDWVSLVRLQFVILLRDAGLSIADIAAIDSRVNIMSGRPSTPRRRSCATTSRRSNTNCRCCTTCPTYATRMATSSR